MSNPYQGWFDKLDACVAALEDLTLDHAADKDAATDAATLLRQAGFVLANLLNVNATVLPALILPVEGEVESTEGDSPPPVPS